MTGGLISSFSSFGVSPDLSLKPDLAAPGGQVRSTLPIELGSYGSLSGTSMASPHVAGAAALLLEARPKTAPDEVMARFRGTSIPRPWFGNPSLGFLDNVHRQGGGMIQIPAAIEAEALVTPSKLALGEIEAGGSAVQRIQIRTVDAHGNRGKGGQKGNAGVTYTLSHEPALSTGPNTFAPSFNTGAATVISDRATMLSIIIVKSG